MLTRKRKGAPANNKKECKCIKHGELTLEKPQKRLHTVTSRDYSKRALNYLKDRNLFGNESSYVCDVCIEYALEKLAVGEQNNREVAMDSMNNSAGEVMQEAEVEEGEISTSAAANSLPDSEADTVDDENLIRREKIAEAIDCVIGGLADPGFVSDQGLNRKLSDLLFVISRILIQPSITEHNKHLQGKYQDIEHLQKLDSLAFISSVSPFITNFLSGCSGRDFSMITDSEMLYRIAVAIEGIYHLKNSNTVLPHCFLTNLTQRQISGSKTVSVVNGKLLPGAGDTVLQDWWEDQGSEELVPPSSGNLAYYYDNVGKYIVPAFRVKGERNTTPTVVTATQCIEMSSPTPSLIDLQTKPTYQTALADSCKADIQVKM